MADIDISNVSRRVVYAASGTGPYAFTFEILAQTDIAVYRDDTLLTLTTDYTVVINTNGTGEVTLTAAPTGAIQISIVGDRTIQRTTEFQTGGDLFAASLNEELDSLTIFAQQNAEGVSRALRAPETDPTSINMVLPRVADRAGKFLSFDSSGNPVPGAVPPELDDVLAISDEIVTVSGIAADVTTVAGIAADVTAVASNEADIDLVATNIGYVQTVGGDIGGSGFQYDLGSITDPADPGGTTAPGYIVTVYNNLDDVETVATNIADVTTVADAIASVIAVGAEVGTDGDITTVAADLEGADTIGTVAADLTNIDLVAGSIASVNSVAGQLGTDGDITTVAADLEGVDTIGAVAADITNVNLVGGSIASVNSVAAQLGTDGDVTDVAANLTDISTVATNIADVNTVADEIGGVGILADIAGLSYTGNATKTLRVNATADGMEFSSAGAGTVTSVDMTVPTGLQVANNPITSTGTLAITYATGYAIPTTSSQSNWDTAYGWGNHALAGYLTSVPDGDKGDITVSATGATWTIDNNVVTVDKLATTLDLGSIA